MKKLTRLLLLFVVFNLLLSTTAFAKDEHARKSLVALGDSIPYGYNLGQSNHAPSKLAFPYLIGEKINARVQNLSVPGQTTTDMLAALKDPNYREAIKKADYITLNIGGNDLLNLLLQADTSVSEGTLNNNATLQSPPLVENIKLILYEIRDLNPTAPIVLYNIYNPFLNQQIQLPPNAEIVLSIANACINKLASDMIYIANAYSTLIDSKDIIPGDVHPTKEGQQKLAEIGLDAIKNK